MKSCKCLTSSYIRAWCQEWALPPYALEQILVTYAVVDSNEEVLACMAGLANAQLFRLRRAGMLITLQEFEMRPGSLPEMDFDYDWNVPIKGLCDRFF